jgi:hypothetical protein
MSLNTSRVTSEGQPDKIKLPSAGWAVGLTVIAWLTAVMGVLCFAVAGLSEANLEGVAWGCVSAAVTLFVMASIIQTLTDCRTYLGHIAESMDRSHFVIRQQPTARDSEPRRETTVDAQEAKSVRLLMADLDRDLGKVGSPPVEPFRR